jgi:hypothetical protein
LYLRSLLGKAEKTDERKTLQESIDSIEQSLNFDIERWRDARSSYTGSLFITYSLATSLLGSRTPPEKELGQFREFVDLHGIDTLPYSPPPDGVESYPFGETQRGSSARGVPAALALLLREKEKKPAQYLNLLKALYNYNFHSYALVFHVNRKETHVGHDALAPYYYYSTIPYATASVNQLLEQDLPAEHRKELEDVAETLRRGLLSQFEGGNFARMGKEVNSEVYATPFGGLALLPYCEKEKQKAVTGILGEKLPDFSAHARGVKPGVGH